LDLFGRGLAGLASYVKRCEASETSPKEVKAAIEWVRRKAGEMYGRYVDLKSFEKELEREAEKLGRAEELNQLREALGPLTCYGSGLLTTLYDEIYLGEEGIREKYGSKPRYVSWRGLLDREVVLVRGEVLEELLRLLPRGITIATGRGRWETERVLGSLTKYFDLDVAAFSADNPMEYEKPSSKILVECSKRLRAERIIYVGDSFEDLLSARKASEEGLDAFFVGVLTNPYSLDLFIKQEADAIIDDVNMLPKVLKKKEKFWSPY
ncbi:MAG: HAD family hydrolase, partial [Thaumarchaeota archaeon]|nr:HAD family hydrolase [Nitrososphaerota archaeon]